MKKIVFPLKPKMQGPMVADLQHGLRFLLDTGLLLERMKAGPRRGLTAALAREGGRYAETTGRLVGEFQKEHALQLTGEVDEATAAALNEAIFHEKERTPGFQYLVRGQVLYRGGLPISGLTVRAFSRELRKETELGTAKTDENGHFEIYFNPNRIEACAKALHDRPPDVFVRVFEQVRGEEGSGKVLVESPPRFAAQRVVKFRLLVDGE